ncbi:MAG: PKD domain-containing protein [Candidatus Xenobiia bacterium LiM19]
MNNRVKVTVTTVVLLALMLTACGTAYADYGFSPSTNSGYGLGQKNENEISEPPQNYKPGSGAGSTAGSTPRAEASPLQASLCGNIDFMDGSNGCWSANATGGVAPYRYEWSLEGAGVFSTSSTAQRSFHTAGKGGRGNLTLTVWDSAGNCAKVSRLVVIKAKNGQYPQAGLWGF